MNVITYGYHDPGYPPRGSEYPRLDYTPRPLAEVLSEPHVADAVLCPIDWPGAGPAFRPRKTWVLDERCEKTPYRLVMLDYDRPSHAPWPSAEGAASAVSALHRAAVNTFGAAFSFATRRGARVLFLTAAPVPLYLADSYLHAALDVAPVLSSLSPPDRLTWTTGQRPPWVPGAGAPWGDDYPPCESTPWPPVAAWIPPHGLTDERGRLQPRPPTPSPVNSALDASALVRLIAELDAEVLDMVSTLHSSTARHPVLFGVARRLGGYLANLAAPGPVVEALVSRYSGLLADAAPESADATRTVRDGIDAGWNFPSSLPSETVAWFRGGDE